MACASDEPTALTARPIKARRGSRPLRGGFAWLVAVEVEPPPADGPEHPSVLYYARATPGPAHHWRGAAIAFGMPFARAQRAS